MKAVEDFIGNKKFLMGDRICNEDASLFGMLCQVIYHDKGPFNKYVMGWKNFIKMFIIIIKFILENFRRILSKYSKIC